MAVSWSEATRPPRVRSRSMWGWMPASSRANTSSARGAVSLSIGLSNSRVSRASITANPCRPRSPLMIATSPTLTRSGAIGSSVSTRPIPAVLMNIPSPLPRSTTFVSPVTIVTCARCAARAIDCTTRHSVAIGKPSSRIKPTLRYKGRAPAMARSLTVPFTASSPMSPPGKNSGLTT